MNRKEVQLWLNSLFILRGYSINNPDANVGVCCSHKVVAVGFNTLCYDAERRGIKPSARIKYLVRLPNLNAY